MGLAGSEFPFFPLCFFAPSFVGCMDPVPVFSFCSSSLVFPLWSSWRNTNLLPLYPLFSPVSPQVSMLPFIDQHKLLAAMRQAEALEPLTAEEEERNALGWVSLWSCHHASWDS